MQDVLTTAAIYGVLIPALVAALFLVLEQPPWRGDTPFRAGWGAAIGLGLGHVAGHVGVNGAPEGIAAVVAVAVLVGMAEWAFAGGRADWLRWLLRAGSALVVAFGVVGYMFEHTWTTTRQDLMWGGIVVAVTTAFVGTIDEIGRRHPGATVPIAFVILGAGASGYMFSIGTARVAQMFGVLAAMGGAGTVHAWWRGNTRFARGGVAVWGLIFAGLFMGGYFGVFGPPKWPALAFVLVPHVLWIGELPGLSKLDGWKGTLLRVVVLAAAVAAISYWAAEVIEAAEAADAAGSDGGTGGGEGGTGGNGSGEHDFGDYEMYE